MFSGMMGMILGTYYRMEFFPLSLDLRVHLFRLFLDLWVSCSEIFPDLWVTLLGSESIETFKYKWLFSKGQSSG